MRVLGAGEQVIRSPAGRIAVGLAAWVFALCLLAAVTGCALTPVERCAQVQSARLLAESMEPTPDREKRIEVYKALELQYCAVPQ